MAAFLLGLAPAIFAGAAAPVCDFEIGPEVDLFHYREPGLMKEDGFLYGGFASLTATFNSNLAWNVGASFAAGTLRYDGQTMDGEPVSIDTPDRLFTGRTTLGYRFKPVMPFAGIGVRYWSDNLGANSPMGYKRETTYLYSPVGMEISGTFGDAWTLGARVEFDWFWVGLNRNTDFPLADNATLDFRQNSGYGAQAALFLKHPVTRSLGLTLEPFFQYWDIGKSEEKYVVTTDGVYAYFEPSNESSMFGLRGGLLW